MYTEATGHPSHEPAPEPGGFPMMSHEARHFWTRCASLVAAAVVLGVACAPATGGRPSAGQAGSALPKMPDAVPTSSMPAKDTNIRGSAAEWEKALAAGRTEGTLSIITHPSLQFSAWVPI